MDFRKSASYPITFLQIHEVELYFYVMLLVKTLFEFNYSLAVEKALCFTRKNSVGLHSAT
jgi:hypothetical protein